MNEDDPYASVSLHGLWPLVPDPGSVAGVRFAVLGQDEPGACIADPSGLPDTVLELRTFLNGTALGGWRAAVEEFAGDGTAALPGPDVPARPFRYALLARPGRGRRDVATLDLAISLDTRLDPFGTDLRAVGAEARRAAAEAWSAARAKRDWRAAWEPHLASMASLDAFDPRQTRMWPDGGLRFATSGVPPANGHLSATPGGVVVGMTMPSPRDLDPDLSEGLATTAAGHGWSVIRETATIWEVERPVPSPDVAGMAALAGDAAALVSAHASALAMQANRRTVTVAAVDAGLVHVLRRMARGMPVASGRVRDPGAQFNPGPCKTVRVAASRISLAHRSGLIEPRWWPGKGAPPPDRMECVVWGLTPAGAALADGDLLASASALARQTAGPRAGTGEAALDGLASPGATSPGDAAKVALALGGAPASRPMPREPHELCLVAAGLACGALVPDGDGRCRAPSR